MHAAWQPEARCSTSSGVQDAFAYLSLNCRVPPQPVMLEFFPQLLALAQQLLRAPSELVRAAGMELYCCMYCQFTEGFNQTVRAMQRWLPLFVLWTGYSARASFCRSPQHSAYVRASVQVQEVLRALHSHLGAQVAAETSAALQVLQRLSQQQTASLLGYAAFLTNILDYVDAYSDQQVQQARAVQGSSSIAGLRVLRPVVPSLSPPCA